MKTAILTMATSHEHKAILAKTISLMRDYSKRTNSEYIVTTNQNDEIRVPHYQKLQLIEKALQDFDRVAWIDADVLVSRHAPNIFDMVPEHLLGAFNEAPWVSERHRKDIEDYRALSNFSLKSGVYYNTGVMVVGAAHRALFSVPAFQVNHYGEQSYLNQVFQQNNVDMFNLSYHWNRMSCTHTPSPLGEDPFVSHMIHFAGEKGAQLPEFIGSIAKQWQERGYQGDRRIVVHCNNGMGNQIASTPAIAELMRAHPDHIITLQTHFPQVYDHIKGPKLEVKAYGESFSYPFAKVLSTAMTGVLQDVMMHPLSFHALSLLGREIPAHRRKVSVPPSRDKVVFKEPTVAIHAGKSGWESKEMPIENWQIIADRLKANGIKIAIIGDENFSEKNGKDSNWAENKAKRKWGAFRLENVDFDYINCDYPLTCEVIKNADFLLTNDSMPVHAAGAFDNWIGLITIAKRPEFILPHRSGKHITWCGTPLWEVKPETVLHRPDEEFDVGKMYEGMAWPDPEEIAWDIIAALNPFKKDQ